MINIGNTEIADIYIGLTPIEKVYLGGTLLWERTSSGYDPYDMTDFVTGYRLYTSPAGSLRSGSSYTVTRFYELVAGHSYKAYASGGSRNYTYGYTYKSDQTAKTRYQVGSSSLATTFTAASDEAYFRMTFTNAGLANSYIQDTTTGEYLFKGANL